MFKYTFTGQDLESALEYFRSIAEKEKPDQKLSPSGKSKAMKIQTDDGSKESPVRCKNCGDVGH